MPTNSSSSSSRSSSSSSGSAFNTKAIAPPARLECIKAKTAQHYAVCFQNPFPAP
jgi:hypothetical protein